jgi:hypothetical protein
MVPSEKKHFAESLPAFPEAPRVKTSSADACTASLPKRRYSTKPVRSTLSTKYRCANKYTSRGGRIMRKLADILIDSIKYWGSCAVVTK